MPENVKVTDVTGHTEAPVQGTQVNPEKQVITQETPKAPEQDKRFIQLARKERALRQESKRLQALKAQIEASKKPPELTWEERFKKNPLSVMTPEELQSLAVNALNTDPQAQRIAQLEAKLNEVVSLSNNTLNSVQEKDKQAYDRAVKQVSREVRMLVDGNPDFETIHTMNAQEAVVELIKNTYEEDGILLSAKEAAKDVEDFLLEEVIRASKIKKLQALKQQEAEKQASARPTQQQQGIVVTDQRRQAAQSGPATLTNSMSVNSTRSSEKQRVERAKLAFQGKL